MGPFAASVRQYFEGENPEVCPLNPDVRWMIPKEWTFEPSHLLIFFLCAVLFSIMAPLVSMLISYPLTNMLNLLDTDKKRFVESFWQLCFYTPAWIIEVAIVYNAPWFQETFRVWEPPFPRQIMTDDIFWLYTIQIGWYLHCTFFHVAVDARKADFIPMLIHHITALALLFSAFGSGYYRCGVLTLFCMDVCDIFLHAGKVFRLIDNANPLSPLFLVVFYLCLVSSWITFRLVLFVRKVLYASFIQSVHYGGWINSDNWLFFNALLFIILALQVYWFYLIILSGYKYIRFGEEIDDERDRHVTPKSLKRKKVQ